LPLEAATARRPASGPRRQRTRAAARRAPCRASRDGASPAPAPAPRLALTPPRPAQVKFARHLASECVPEWREAYVDYKRLKKVLSAVRDGVEEDAGSGVASDEGGTRGSAASSDGSTRSGGVRGLLSRSRQRLATAESAEAGGSSPSLSAARAGTDRPRRRGHPRGAEGLITVRWSAPGRDGAPQVRPAFKLRGRAFCSPPAR